jgi:perosamine synthetase
MAAVGLQPGDEVIMPTFTSVSCALAVIYNGGVPVLVDAEPRTWCMDVSQIEARITPRTRAIMVVHIYGHPVDIDPILALARQHGMLVIEDAAEAHGAEYLTGRHGASPAWKRCGSLGHLSTFSFYANKLITTGEGGMVLTDDAGYAEKARSFRNLCLVVPYSLSMNQQVGPASRRPGPQRRCALGLPLRRSACCLLKAHPTAILPP